MDFQNGKIETALNGGRKIPASDTQIRDVYELRFTYTSYIHIYIYM